MAEEQTTGSDGEMRMNASCFTKKTPQESSGFGLRLQSQVMARQEGKASGSLAFAHVVAHVCLFAISMVLFHSGAQRMRTNSIPKELLLGQLVMWHVGC